MCKYSIPFHIPVTHRLSSILHSLHLRCPTLHRDADEQGALGPPLSGLSVIFCPDKTLPTCPRAWEWGSTGVHIISPTCARPHQLRMSFYANSFLHPIMSQLFHLRSLNKSRVNDTRTHVGSNEMTTTTNLRLCLQRALHSSFHPKALII